MKSGALMPLVAALCLAGPLGAQEGVAPTQGGGQPTSESEPVQEAQLPGDPSRILGGHQFIPSARLGDAFLGSYLRSNTGGGIAQNVQAELRDLDGTLLGNLEGNLAFLMLDVEFQYQLADWLALNASYYGTGRVGTSGQSALAQGVTSVFGFQAEARARILRTESVQLTGALRAQPSTVYRFTPLDFAQDVLDRGGLSEDAEIVQSEDGLGLALGLRGVWGVRDWLGLGATVETGAANPLADDDDSEARLSGSVFASIDLAPRTDVPVGFILSYHRDSFSERGDDIAEEVRNLEAGVFYTGRSDFLVGLQVTRSRLPIRDLDEALQGTMGTLTLRYWF